MKISFGTTTLPVKSILYFSLCAIGFVIFIIFFNFFTQKEIVQVKKEMSQLEYQIYAHSIFSPFFDEIQKRLSIFEKYQPLLATQQSLPQHQTSQVPTVIHNIAEKSGLLIRSVTVDPQSFQEDGTSVLVKIKLGGNINSFRHFLREINKLSYVQYLEQINISPASSDMEYDVNLWLRLTH